MKNTIFVNTIDKCEDKDNIDIKFKKCHTNTGNLVQHDRCRQEIAYDNIIQLNEVNNFSENNILQRSKTWIYQKLQRPARRKAA